MWECRQDQQLYAACKLLLKAAAMVAKSINCVMLYERRWTAQQSKFETQPGCVTQFMIDDRRMTWKLSSRLVCNGMEEFQLQLTKARKTGFRVTAYVTARILRRDLHGEVDRLENQSRSKSYIELAVLLCVLFALAVFAASFGWIGLSLYFVAAMMLFY